MFYWLKVQRVSMTQGYSGEETTLQIYFAKQQDG